MKLIHIIPLFFCTLSAIAADTVTIQSEVMHTTATKAQAKAMRDVTTQSGKPVTTEVDDCKLTILPTFGTGDSIRIESTFTEHASAPNAKSVKLPAVSATNGKKAAVVVGAFTFEFTPTIKREQK